MTDLERAARALCTVDEQDGGAPWDWHLLQRNGVDGYFERVKAVLKAIREPSDEVLQAPTRMLVSAGDYTMHGGEAEEALQAMIDFILSQKA